MRRRILENIWERTILILRSDRLEIWVTYRTKQWVNINQTHFAFFFLFWLVRILMWLYNYFLFIIYLVVFLINDLEVTFTDNLCVLWYDWKWDILSLLLNFENNFENWQCSTDYLKIWRTCIKQRLILVNKLSLNRFSTFANCYALSFEKTLQARKIETHDYPAHITIMNHDYQQ